MDSCEKVTEGMRQLLYLLLRSEPQVRMFYVHSNKKIFEDNLVGAKETYGNTFGRHFHMWQDEALEEYEAY